MSYLPTQAFQIPEAQAADEEKPNNKLGIIAILAEEGLMADFDMRSRIMTYAENAQSRIPHSKAVVIEVKKDESTFKISSLLEKLYFEGVDADAIDGNPLNNDSKTEDDNQLIGVVMIGDVPVPVVHEEDGRYLPSVYPYTDFYQKAYIYDHQTDQFEANSSIKVKTPEVWHGLIVPPSKDPAEAKKELMAYFEKNNAYTQGKEGYADFEQRMLYANFSEMEKKMNLLDYNNYKRYITYMEEMVFKRFNKKLLKEFIASVSKDMEASEPVIDDKTIANMFDIYTETIFNQYALNLVDALKTYRGGLNKVVDKTGRWGTAEVDSPESLIALRDEYAKNELHRSQLILEKKVDDFIEKSVPVQDRELDLVTLAQLKVKLSILDINVDNHSFDFLSYIDGLPISTVNSVGQCGIQKGEKSLPNKTAGEDNSVLVNANRLYDTDSLIKPPQNPDKDWKAENTDTYKTYAGCVFNNSLDKTDQCKAAEAEKPVFDIKGSIEVKPNEPVYSDEQRCAVEKMNFLLNINNTFADPAAVGNGKVIVNQSLTDVINNTYAGLQGNLPNPTLKQKANFVIQKLLATEETFEYSPALTAKVEVSVTGQAKKIDSIYAHVEPTNETIKAIKHIGEPRVDANTGELKFPQLITPSLPADGRRLVSFVKNGTKDFFEYLNFFRIDGVNTKEVTEDLLKKMVTKENELSQKTGVKAEVIEDFFAENSDVLEPLVWKTESLDQKLIEIIPKYVDRDSVMPSPDYNPAKSPQNKPEGYEVLHIVADGDAHGYQFGVNRAMQSQSPAQKEQVKKDEAALKQAQEEQQKKQDAKKPQVPPGNYICGDPSGVEVWQWFGSLQCWVENEILPAQDLFSLSQMCTAAPLPGKEEPEKADIFDEILAKAAAFKVEMKRKTLIVGQEIKMMISAFSDSGEPLLGYIDMPIHFTLADPSLGEFSANDVYIFSGQREVKFMAKKAGSTELTVQMGELPAQKFQLTVLDGIHLKWSASEEKINGISQFTIQVTAVDEKGNTLTNIDDEIILAPETAGDGGFEKDGKVTLKNGTGQIKFIPAPGKQEIRLLSKDPSITSDPFVIKPSKPAASQIILKSPASYLEIGSQAQIEVTVADEFGFPVDSFNGSINFSLTKNSKPYATLPQISVKMKNGKGKVTLKARKETADVTLNAVNAELKPGSLTIPLVARVDTEKWKKTYPQNLFASFVGFPAGDFTQEDYFGGVDLMAGKTQAVYSFLSAPSPVAKVTIEANHLIKLTSVDQTVLADFSDKEMVLQAFDQKTKQSLFTKKEPLNFDAVEMLPKENLEKGKMYLEALDQNYVILKKGEGFEIKSAQNETIAEIEKDKVTVVDPAFKWEYVPDPEFGAVEMELTDGLITPARLILNFKPEVMSVTDFSEINPNLTAGRTYGGKSVTDAAGLSFFDSTAETPQEERDEFYGLKGDNNYLSLFASGTNIGEAVKFNLPTTGILLGDPTIKLKTKSTNGLNYNPASGEKIYQDQKGAQVASIKQFDFNNDDTEDVAVLLSDGRVRLLEGGATNPPYKDRGDIALLADGGIALESLDLKKDGYEDLLVATKEGRLAFLNNDKENFTRSDQKLEVGKQIRKLFLTDMDQDGYKDLVILDSQGNIYIFYYDPKTKKFPQKGMLVGNYGFSLKLNENLNTDLDIRYTGMPEPEGLTDDKSAQSQVPLDQFEGGGKVDDQAALDFYKKLQEEADKQAKDPYAAQTNIVPKLPWPEGNEVETYFAPIESIGTLAVKKNLRNKDQPGETAVDLEDTLTYQIELNSIASFKNVVVADVLPDSLTFDPTTLVCVQGGCADVQVKQNGTQLFFSGMNLKPGEKTIFTYNAKVEHTPEADIFIQKIEEPNENLKNPKAIVDKYLDIVVSPPFNNTGKLLYQYSTGPRTYSVIQSNEPKPKVQNEAVGGFSEIMKQMEALKNGDYDPNNPPSLKMPGMEDAMDEATGNNDCLEDPDSLIGCAEQSLDKLGEKIKNLSCVGGGCFPMPYNKAFLVPPDMPIPTFAFPTTLPTPAGAAPFVWPGSFIGASNVPGPISSQMRFYVSPTLTGGVGIAMCWGPYPTSPTVPPPVFPIPYPPPTGNCMVQVIPAEVLYGGLCSEIAEGMDKLMDLLASGVNKIQSAVNSVNNNPNVPVNIQPTGPDNGAGGLEVKLETNLGKALKFNPPVKTFSNIHLSGFDSVGGVISGWVDRQMLEIQSKLLTLPTMTVYLPDTKSLFTADFEKTQKRFEGWLNTMNGSAAATLDALPQIGGAAGDAKEGGYESYLTDEVRANPLDIKSLVLKGALQCKEGTYDGADMKNGFQSPDCEPVKTFKGDVSDTEKMAIDGFTNKNGTWIYENGVWYFAKTDNSLTAGQAIRMGLQDVSGSKALQYKKTIDTQASIYNLNALEGLYDVASTLPLVKLTEKPIELKVPWLSAGEIQSYILELQNWIIYYEQEYDRVKDKWEALKCDNLPDPNKASDYAKNAANCAGRQLADAFGANFDKLINSAKENIVVLQSYLAFPKELASYKTQLAGYVGSVACYLDVIAQMMGGYMATIKQQMIKWAETILTIKEVVKNIKELFNVFTNFESNCETCANERYGNFGWWSLLGIVLPDIPVIQFPKIPDIVLDLSKIDMMLDIELPVLNIRPEPIPLPPLPYISLPDFPNVSVFLQLPPLPILPKLPTLPPLPELPPLPVLDLPTLPPPPKLPDVGKAFEKIIPLIEKILQTWCLMKKSLAPVPEQSLGEMVALQTMRPAYLIPLDLLQVQAPKIALFDTGFNQLRIEAVIYLGLKIDAPSKTLEEVAQTWDGWIKKIPEAMDKAYQDYLDATEGQVQGLLDKADTFMETGAQAFEEAFDKYVQGWLDKNVGDPLAESDKWLKDKEKEWQKWADEQGIKISYEQYYTQINTLYEKVRALKNEKVSAWFEQNREIIQGLNYLMPSVKLFDVLSDKNFAEYQQEMLDLTAEKLAQLGTYGPTLMPRLYTCLRYYSDCRINQEKYFGPLAGTQPSTKETLPSPVVPEVQPQPQTITQAPQVSDEAYANELLKTKEGKEIGNLFGEIAQTIDEVNNAEMVDYTVLKEKFGVEDYQVAPRNTTVDKLKRMEEELTAHSEKLYAEAEGLKQTKDLNAIAGVLPNQNLPFDLATSEADEALEARVMTGAVESPKLLAKNDVQPLDEQIKELQEKIKNQNQAVDQIQANPTEDTSGCTADLCLPDPITEKPVPVVPLIEALPESETLFMSNGHLIYSDGAGVYLKKDLTVNDSDQNTDVGMPQRFSLEDMRIKLKMEIEPKEAVNMFNSQFTQNGAATFNWLAPTHKDVYGYGLEVEKRITGFDHNKQTSTSPDVKIVLLPPDAQGNTPDVFVKGQKIEFGTLITNLGTAEEAEKRFGIKASNFLTGASEVDFPTINKAKINVSENKAIYFDQLQGSGLSVPMVNGFYHVKMTWFDQQAHTATYNETEILAPQSAGDNSEPLIINQDDRFYTPIYKQKTLKASDIFSDLSGIYNYYWFVGGAKTPEIGGEYVVPPQNSLKEIKIKLVASQDITDPGAKKFEKEFVLEVYSPGVELSQEDLNKGLIAGQLKAPKGKADDYDGIPFSVFRNRDGTWKNLGILHAQDKTKKPTAPPLNDSEGKKQSYADSYYSAGVEGNYEISGFDILDPSPLIIKDHQGNKVTEMTPGNGLIKILDAKYELKAVPATQDTPTRIVIILKQTQEIIANIYYIADKTQAITLVKTALTYPNVAKTGVTVGDSVTTDQIVASPIPTTSPNFPGGVDIFDQTTKKNIALIDKDGTIRLMDENFDLSLKPKTSETDPYIFQIIKTKEKTALMDIFIQTDWKNLSVDKETKMTTLPKAGEKDIVSSNDSKPSLPGQGQKTNPSDAQSKLPANPFTDVPTTHPYYKEIMELYSSDVVKGFNDKTFKPDQPLTRGEFIKISLGVTNCFDCEKATDPQKARYTLKPFPDVNLPLWYFYCVWVAKELKMITGYGDGQFRPEQNISRAEAAAILLRQSDVKLQTLPQNQLKDVASDAWYKDYVYTGVQMGLIQAKNGTVKPNEAITRGEFAFMATTLQNFKQCRLVDEDKDGNFDWWEMTHNLDPLRADAGNACACRDNPNQKDTDKDGLRDVCDLDIDNDGTLNPMCVFDEKGNFSQTLVESKASDLGKKEKVDNCVFLPNADQSDYDNNGIGDSCEVCACSDNPNQNDTDKDGLKDACDIDIDNDQKKNPICIFDLAGIVDTKKLQQTGDNCIFDPNTDQKDLNKNGVGDACESGDLCPALPEDMDGIADEDGCPEVNDNFKDKAAGIYVGPGPLCELLDYKSDFMPGDIFMTAITDTKTHDTIFTKSKELTYK